ncbi:MAG: restriction endonuclease, partial [Ectopseudomonas oleovorans]
MCATTLQKAKRIKMDLPKFNETFIPILEILRDGKIIKGRELIRRVEENFYS